MVDANEEEVDREDENPFQVNEMEGEDEFSLEQLSQAYAKVLKEQEEGGRGDVESVEGDGSSNETAENEIKETPTPESDKADQEDILDDAPCQVDPHSILEAVLFVGTPKGEKLTARKIAALMRDVSPKEIKSIVKDLNARYKTDGSAYRIVFEDGAYQMRLAKEFESVKERFYGEIRVAKLSQPAIDVLAVVAYHQPLSREQVEKIRIRPSGSILNQLVRRQLLAIEESDSKPKKRLYITTDRFLELFGLDGLGDLPQSHEAAIDELSE